jgi:FkbM family methyltransferase
MRKIIKGILKKFLGKELAGNLIRWRMYKKHSRRGRFARYGMDKKLESLLPHRNGFYVELGANDGALASNSYYFELKKDWTGVLIEPSPNLYLSCLKRRGEKNYVFCNACVPFDYVDEYVTMKYSDSMTISDSLTLDIGDKSTFIQSGDKYLQPGERTFEFGAKAAPLNTLLDTANAPSLIDFLSLDVEGAELAVLQGIDFKKFNFKYMLIECREIDRLTDFLSPFGYVLKEKVSHHDYLFALESNLA